MNKYKNKLLLLYIELIIIYFIYLGYYSVINLPTPATGAPVAGPPAVGVCPPPRRAPHYQGPPLTPANHLSTEGNIIDILVQQCNISFHK